jgi:hypothetical protein
MMRITILTLIQWSKHADSDDDERPKKSRESSDDGGKLQNIDCKGQIERLIVRVPTYHKVSAPVLVS